jgi:hypothetical protein
MSGGRVGIPEKPRSNKKFIDDDTSSTPSFRSSRGRKYSTDAEHQQAYEEKEKKKEEFMSNVILPIQTISEDKKPTPLEKLGLLLSTQKQAVENEVIIDSDEETNDTDEGEGGGEEEENVPAAEAALAVAAPDRVRHFYPDPEVINKENVDEEMLELINKILNDQSLTQSETQYYTSLKNKITQLLS